MEASAFQIGNKGRPHTNTVSISRLLPHVLSPMTSRLHSTPMTDLPFADTETKVSTTDFILSEIAINDVVVFSATYCPHCVQTKQLFDRIGISAKIIELDKISNGLGPAKDSIALKLLELTGQRTVPNVFVMGKHLGGNDEAHDAARSGALKQMLAGESFQ